MSLEYYTIDSLGTNEVKMSKAIKHERDSRDMSYEALLQTQIIQQDGKLLRVCLEILKLKMVIKLHRDVLPS